MNIINIPKDYTYLSDVPEFKDGFPDNSIIDKQVTGCGGTHLALTNKEPYVIAVHAIRMIKGKIEQDKYKHVLEVTGETSINTIQNYIEEGGIKILTTYDSVPKVQTALQLKTKTFKLLVDEVHQLIRYMDKFKPSIVLKLLERSFNFKSVCYLTATPTNPKWLPEPFKDLNYYKLEWENAVKPNITHKYISNNITEATLASMLNILDDTNNELYIFYNSKRNASSLIKKLLKCKPELTIEDINILFADTDENTRYFNKTLGKHFTYGSFPNGYNNKRINIISSMGFEGSDFIPNIDESILPISIIVSDPTSKSMRFDISIDLVQIAGRFRATINSKQIKIYPIIYLWNTQKNDYIQSEEECHKILKQEQKDSIEMIEFSQSNAKQKQALFNIARTQEDRFIIVDDTNIILHPYGIEVGMSCYNAMHSDSYVLNNVDENDNVKDDSIIVSKLSNLDPDVNTYSLPIITAEYSKKLGRRPSVVKLITEFETLIDNIKEFKDEKSHDNYNNFLIENPDFTEWLESGVSISNMNTVGRKREAIDAISDSNRRLSSLKDDMLKFLNLKLNNVYTKSYLKERMQEYYNNRNIKLKAKASDIQDYYEVKSTLNTNRDSAFKIIKRKN